MTDLGNQIAYWDAAGATKTFTHPLNYSWLAGVSRDARVLDFGCGYGRTMVELREHGFTNLTGVDVSPAMIARGSLASPDLSFAVLESPPALPHADASFDLVVLFAVLTCIPDSGAQRALVGEVKRVLAPAGLLYVSDLVLQDDDRNRSRYAAYANECGGPYGVFATDNGAVCRHHDPEELRLLLSGFDREEERMIDVRTMNGRKSTGMQLLLRQAER
jgi:SAM-dependent methyltransferase